MRHRFAIVLGLGLGAHFLSAGCSGTSGLTCDDLRTPCGDGGPTTVDDGSLVGDGAQGPDANVTPGDDGASEASSNDDSGFDSGPLCGTLTDCEEAGCVDTTSSVDNCGACGKVCPGASNGGATCTASTCSIGCDTGFTDCSGTCANEQTDPKHCGSCTACPVPANGTATCASAKCGISCNAGYENCGGACVGPDDPAHCGASCTVCAGPASGNGNATCATGSCGIACNAGWFQCNGDCHSETAPPTDSCTVTSAFAVFVSTTGTDAPSSGTPTAPYATISYALANTKGLSRVYVCSGTYTSPVTVGSSASSATVYGGFSCVGGTWAYAPATQTVKVAPAGSAPALVMSGVTAAVEIENVTFASGSATAAGGSSIAGEVSGSSGAIEFVSCVFNAGKGANGANGATPSAALPVPLPGNPAETLTNNGGAATNACTCPYGAASYGGSGGTGGAVPSDGSSGQPLLSSDKGNAPTTNPGSCSNGLTGANATPPASNGPGALAVGSVVGDVWTPLAGTAGTPGGTGQGGGGGGGGYSSTTALLGNGGGGGGCGGCGGGGGGFGGGGGASIGLLVLSSPAVQLSSCTVVTAGGGSGGAGAAGQAGASGGIKGGADLAGNGCPGGSGGNGGAGGAGGGGAGGVSAGIAWNGTKPTVDSATTTATTVGAAGPKGTGGAAGTNDGVPGTSGTVVGL